MINALTRTVTRNPTTQRDVISQRSDERVRHNARASTAGCACLLPADCQNAGAAALNSPVRALMSCHLLRLLAVAS